MAIQFKQYLSALSFEQRVELMRAFSTGGVQKVIGDIIDDARKHMSELPAPSGNPAADASFVASYLDLRRVKELLEALQQVCVQTQQEFLRNIGNQSEEH